jgi:DNA repair exonuclease SbcCD ATPase subunit
LEEEERHEGNGGAPTDGASGGDSEAAELRARIGIKDNRIRELIQESTDSRLASDEARAAREAAEEHVASLTRDRDRLRERVRELEEGARARRRRREGIERQVERLEREIERLGGEIARRDYLLERRAEELDDARRSAEEDAARRDAALRTALGRVEGLERDLEDREAEISDLQDRVEALQDELDSERALREGLADPNNRLRAGIELFNDSEGRHSMNALSRTLGRPEVHVGLGEGEEPPALLYFTWRGVTWQTYAADPNPAVREPRVYLTDSGEDLSGVESKPPNAHVGPAGRVALGL